MNGLIPFGRTCGESIRPSILKAIRRIIAPISGFMRKKEEITLARINPHTGERLGDIKAIWEGTGGGYLEAPHIYHVGEWYYLFTAEGGTDFNHMETVARSKSIWGPYESCPWNPILTNAHDTTKQIQCSGHGDLLEDHRGNWWMVHLGIRIVQTHHDHTGTGNLPDAGPVEAGMALDQVRRNVLFWRWMGRSLGSRRNHPNGKRISQKRSGIPDLCG